MEPSEQMRETSAIVCSQGVSSGLIYQLSLDYQSLYCYSDSTYTHLRPGNILIGEVDLKREKKKQDGEVILMTGWLGGRPTTARPAADWPAGQPTTDRPTDQPTTNRPNDQTSTRLTDQPTTDRRINRRPTDNRPPHERTTDRHYRPADQPVGQTGWPDQDRPTDQFTTHRLSCSLYLRLAYLWVALACHRTVRHHQGVGGRVAHGARLVLRPRLPRHCCRGNRWRQSRGAGHCSIAYHLCVWVSVEFLDAHCGFSVPTS